MTDNCTLFCNQTDSILVLCFIMLNKDYYQLLQIPVNASSEQIKQAFRRLAHQYHPDKTGEDQLAAEHFSQIKEAYEILIDPQRRQLYHYKRFNITLNAAQIITPASVLQKCLDLGRITEAIGYNHIDFDLLRNEIEKILYSCRVLLTKKLFDTHTRQQVTNEILICCKYLPFTQFVTIGNSLQELANHEQQKEIHQLLKAKKQQMYWERYKLLLAITIALLLCALIFLAK